MYSPSASLSEARFTISSAMHFSMSRLRSSAARIAATVDRWPAEHDLKLSAKESSTFGLMRGCVAGPVVRLVKSRGVAVAGGRGMMNNRSGTLVNELSCKEGEEFL